jgi:hypothetical protein
MECINATSLRRKSGHWGTQLSLYPERKHSNHFFFGPGTLVRTWGTRPFLLRFLGSRDSPAGQQQEHDVEDLHG